MDIRTFGQTQRTLRRENSRLRAENERLTDELSKCVSENNQLTEHIAELQSDDVYTERQNLIAANVRLLHDNNALRAELDNERNAHNATAAQLYAKLDAQAKRHADVIERWKVEENTWHEFDKEQLTQIAALRAELDAMRETHSVVAARMAAMGC